MQYCIKAVSLHRQTENNKQLKPKTNMYMSFETVIVLVIALAVFAVVMTFKENTLIDKLRGK